MSATTYYLETFGCQMNVLDSQLVEGQLRTLGLGRIDNPSAADVVLFNTCSVREHAEAKVLSRLGKLRSTKFQRPEMVIGVIGCMAEREREGLFVKAPHIDLLCGPGELDRLPGLLGEVWARQERVTALAGSLSRRTATLQRALEYDALEALDLSRTPGTEERVLQSYIRVQRGCDKFCTYCVVPFTRGAERSRPAAHIVAEARMLAARGCREITLLGQTVNSYVHQEEDRPIRFARLLERVHEVPGIDRIRFVTSFPADWDTDIFRVMRDYPKIMPYLHIPAQSGSDRVLKRMRRTYTVAQYLRLMDEARAFVPQISLASDFIVGFSGESADDFEQTCELVRRVEFKNCFVFKYSPRPGTAAERTLPDDVPAAEKARRNHELLAIQNEISLRQKRALCGETLEVLVEGFSKLARRSLREEREPATPFTVQESEQERGSEVAQPPPSASQTRHSQLVGRSPGDLIVVFDGPAELIGALARIRIESATPQTLLGKLESVSSPPRTTNGGGGEPARDPHVAASPTGSQRALPILRTSAPTVCPSQA